MTNVSTFGEKYKQEHTLNGLLIYDLILKPNLNAIFKKRTTLIEAFVRFKVNVIRFPRLACDSTFRVLLTLH